MIQHGPRSSVTRVEVGGVRLVLKEWQRRGPWRLAADLPAGLAGGPGLAQRRGSARAPDRRRRALRIPGAAHAWGFRSHPGCCSRISGRPCRRTRPELDAPQLADALAALLARLHRAGIRHGDLKASHVYLTKGEPGLTARLIDLEDVRFARRLPDRARIRELAQLNASLPDSLPDALRCRAFERYRAALPFRAPPQACLRRVVEASLARAHRWSGKGCAIARRPG